MLSWLQKWDWKLSALGSFDIDSSLVPRVTMMNMWSKASLLLCYTRHFAISFPAVGPRSYSDILYFPVPTKSFRNGKNAESLRLWTL